MWIWLVKMQNWYNGQLPNINNMVINSHLYNVSSVQRNPLQDVVLSRGLRVGDVLEN